MKVIYISTIVIVLAVLLSAIYIIQPTGQLTSRKEVKVGAILWLSGDWAVYGKAVQQGMSIATDELNEKGNYHYSLIFEDDGNFETTKAITASHKLIDVDNVDISIIMAANEGKSLIPLHTASKTPLIVVFDSNSELANHAYSFSMGFSTEGAAKTMAEYAYYNLSVRSVSIVYTYDDWSILIANSFKNSFEQLGGKVSLFDGTVLEENDFRTIITKSKNTDAIYAPVIFSSTIIKQAKELGYSGYLLTGDSLSQDQINVAGNAAEGVYQTNIFVESNEQLKNMNERYIKKYGEKPTLLALTAIGYDAMYAIDAAVRTKGIGREHIKDGLYEINFEGASGIINFDETGMSPRFERIFVVRNGTSIFLT